MKTLLLAVLFYLVIGERSFAEPLEIPRLVDAIYKTPRNLSGDETSLGSYMLGNREILSRMPLKLSSAAQDELIGRMGDDKRRWELRVLYAVVLANQGNGKAQKFLAEQYGSVGDSRISDVMLAIYWVWETPWSGDRKKEDDTKPDMTWAEDIMLAALSAKRLCRVKTPLGGEFAMRDLAVHYGRFEMILTNKKSEKALPILCKYVTDELSLAPEKELFPPGFHDSGASNVVNSLKEWNDAAVEPVMLEVVRCAVRKRADEWALRYALECLIHRKNQAVIDLAKEGLELDHIRASLIGTKHKPYLDAIRNKLADMKDDILTDKTDFWRPYAKAHAELILIMGENADPVPKLMKFAEDFKNVQRPYAIYELKALKDARCVTWAEKMAAAEQDWFVPFCLVELLGEIPGHEATVTLVNLLDVPFDKILPAEGINYTSRDYHDKIRGELEKRTDKKFGTDSAAWRKWLSGKE